MILRQSTAVVISFGPFLDKTDGVTLEVGLVSALDHATTGIKLSKNGLALTIRNATVTPTTYDSYGNYRVTLDTTDTNAVGTLRMQFEEAATCLPVWQDFQVVEEAIYDSLFAASAAAIALQSSVDDLEGRLTAIRAGYLDNLSAGAVALQASVDDLETRLTATRASYLDNLSGGAVALQASVDDLEGRVPDTISLANINAQLDTAIADAKLDHLVAVADADEPVDNSIIAKLAAKGAIADWSSFVNTTESLEAIRDTAPMGTAMRGTDNAALASVCTGPRLAELDAANLPADVAGVRADTDDIQTRVPAALVSGRMDSSVGAMAAGVVTAAAIATDSIDADALAADAITKILTTQLTESYAADGVAPTLAQALFLIQQSIGDFSIVGTTLTVKKLDGSTTAATYTLDSATDPTSRTRAT